MNSSKSAPLADGQSEDSFEIGRGAGIEGISAVGLAMTRQPNFLFIITDQHRADWLGCYGHPVLRTPHIDALAARGTLFEDFHVAAPVCMPNRASLMTGRWPSVHGLRYNGCILPQSATTFVDRLASAGYRTAAIGKSHLQPFTGLPPQGRDFDPDVERIEAWKTNLGDYGQEEPDRYTGEVGYYDFPTPYYGFQHVDMVTGHGDRCGGHYGQWFRQTAPDWQALHDRTNQLPHNYRCPQAFRTPVTEGMYPTGYIRDRAIDFIQNQSAANQPFFAFVSFPDPHHPFNPPGRYWDLYSPDDFELSLPYSAHRNPTPPMRYLRDQWQGAGEQATPQTAMMLDDQALKEMMALTAGMIAFIDDAVGEILQALKANELDQDTVVCFTSDHGDLLGDFNMALKGALPFRGVTRVPFIWSDPRNPQPRRTSALASTVDISATILDRAGVRAFNGIQGQSLEPVLSGNHAEHRDELLIEFNDGGRRVGFDAPARLRSLVTRDWRYTIYLNQPWGELYDLRNDPNETHNLWDDATAAGVRAHLAGRLNHHLTAQMDESPESLRLA